ELDAGAALADHRGDDRLDFIPYALLEGGAALVADGDLRILTGAVGQQPAGFVDDRHPLWLQPIDGGSDDVADGPDLRSVEAATHAYHDRGRGFGRFARKQRPFGQHQMDSRRLDAVDGADGAGK